MQGNTGQGNNQSKPSLSWSQPATPTGAPKATPSASTSTPNTRSTTMNSNTSHTGTYVGIFVGGLIIGALIGWAITGSKNSTPATGSMATTTTTGTSTGSMATTTTGGMVIGAGATFNVVSPQASGFAVMVSNVQVTEPTWVVVYEDHAGTLGNALGAALFLPQSGNNTQSGTVQLLRATMPGQNYLAGESVDDGDKIFSLQTDKPVRNTQGNAVMVQFVAK